MSMLESLFAENLLKYYSNVSIYFTELSKINAPISNYIHYILWDVITYPCITSRPLLLQLTHGYDTPQLYG